jgi:hypothetical protein
MTLLGSTQETVEVNRRWKKELGKRWLIAKLLELMIEKKASDVHITTGSAPHFGSTGNW